MADKIQIGIDADTSAIEKKLSDLQTKIKNFRIEGVDLNLGGPGFGGAFGQKAADRMRQTQMESHKKLQSQIAGELGNQIKQYGNITKKIDEQNKKLKELNKETKEYKDTLLEIDKLKEKELNTIKEVSRLQSQQAQMKALDPRSFQEMGGLGRLGRAFGTGGFGGLNRAATRMGLGGIAGMAGMAAGGMGTALGLVGQGMQGIGDLQYFLADLPARQAGRQVNITQTATQTRARAMRGQNIEDIIFAPERARAVEDTADFFKEADQARRLRATGKAVGAGVGIGASAFGGGKIGAAIGTAIAPGIGTVIGGGVGALGGAILGSNLFGSEEAYNAVFDRDKLSQMTAEDAMKRYETFKMARQLEDPTKYYQKKFFEENRGTLLNLQRSGGLSEQELYGEEGFIKSGAEQFRFAERANATQQMIAAGGSGSAATRGGLNVLALQAQRSMGLTNAGQALGRLSGYMNAEESEDAFIRILSKGVSIGLDDSEFREEQKDYFAQVTAIASQIGGGEEMVAATLTAGIEGDITRRGVQMSADAFQALEGALNQQGGVTAAARAGLISESETFSNIKGMDRLNLQRMQMKDIREDSRAMQMYYKQAQEGGYKGSLEEFVNERQDIQRKSLFQAYKGTDIGNTLSGLYEKGKKEVLTEEDITKAEQMLGNIPEFSGMSEEQRRVLAKQFTGAERIEERDKAERKRQEILKRQQESGLPYGMGDQKKLIDQITGNEIFGMPGISPIVRSAEQTLEERVKKGEGTEIDKIEKAAAEQQSKIFKNLDKNMDEMFQNIKENLNQSLKDQLFMENFAKAVGQGEEALQGFIDKLNQISGKKTGNKNSSEKRRENVGANSRMGGRGY